MRRPIPRDPCEYTVEEGRAVERAYANRREAVKQKARELATKPSEIMHMLDGRVAEQIARLVCAHLYGGDVLHEGSILCALILQRANKAADYLTPDVDEEAIEAQLRGDHE